MTQLYNVFDYVTEAAVAHFFLTPQVNPHFFGAHPCICSRTVIYRLKC